MSVCNNFTCDHLALLSNQAVGEVPDNWNLFILPVICPSMLSVCFLMGDEERKLCFATMVYQDYS